MLEIFLMFCGVLVAAVGAIMFWTFQMATAGLTIWVAGGVMVAVSLFMGWRRQHNYF